MRPLSEAALWGTARHHGLLADTVIVSDDAGQFRVANHALCLYEECQFGMVISMTFIRSLGDLRHPRS